MAKILIIALFFVVACKKDGTALNEKPASQAEAPVPGASQGEAPVQASQLATPQTQEADENFLLMSLQTQQGETRFFPMKMNRDLLLRDWTYMVVEQNTTDGYREVVRQRPIYVQDGTFLQFQVEDGDVVYVNLDTQEKLGEDEFSLFREQANCKGTWTPSRPDTEAAPEVGYWKITKETVLPLAASSWSLPESDSLTLRHADKVFSGDFLSISCKGVKAKALSLSHLRSLLGSKVSLTVPVELAR